MLNWKDELKRYIAKKVKEMTGKDVPLDHIHTVEVNTELDYSSMSIKDLSSIYAFAIMKEDFEDAKKVANELKKRNIKIKIETDENNQSGSINFYLKPEMSTPYIDIKMKVLPDGMMIDFEKENF
jgi:hypothetical protein